MKMVNDLFIMLVWTLAVILAAICLYMAWHYPTFTPWQG